MFFSDKKSASSGLIIRLIQTGDVVMDVRDVPGGRTGFLFCDGAAVSRATYSQLDAVLAASGYPFGNGDGVTTFNIPDFRGRSPVGTGTGVGLTPRSLGDSGGEEAHVLTTAELAIHTHLQNSHNHTQNAHTHTVTDPGHNHTQNAHTHTVTDPGHNHTQNSHNHTQNSHNHTQNAHGHNARYSETLNIDGTLSRWEIAGSGTAVYSDVPGVGIEPTTATNQNTTATNQATTATNISNTTGVTNQNETATNNANTTGITIDNSTATNNATTAVNQNEGGDVAHNTMHPFLCLNFWIKY